MNKILSMKNINIYSDGHNHFVVHNTLKKFNDGHTHIDNFNTAKYIAYLSLYKKIPKRRHLSAYLIDSIIRLSIDSNYIDEMKKLKMEVLSKKNKRVT